jgi:hypothetical protein
MSFTNIMYNVMLRPFPSSDARWCRLESQNLAFIIRPNFHRTSSCVHTITIHIYASLLARNNNYVCLLFFQISFPTNTTLHCHRHLPPRLQNTLQLPTHARTQHLAPSCCQICAICLPTSSDICSATAQTLIAILQRLDMFHSEISTHHSGNTDTLISPPLLCTS